MCGCTSTTSSVGIKASVMSCRGNASASPCPIRSIRSSRVEEPTTTRRVGKTGKISFAAQLYPVGVWLAGETVEVSVANGLVSIHHRGVLVATHAQRHRPAKESAALDPEGESEAATAASGDRRPVRDAQGRLVRRRVASPVTTTGRQAHTPAARSRSRSSATRSRSQPVAKSSECIRSVTTAHARTAPSPTPAADPPAATPPNPSPAVEHSYRSQSGTRVPGLDTGLAPVAGRQWFR